MSDEKGYKDLKEFVCTGCEEPVMLTKFASQKNCLCPKCKEAGIKPNPEIVERALAKNPPKPRTTTKQTSEFNGDNTKERPCIKCGTMTVVSKFMSDKKVLCDTCKDSGVSANDVEIDDSDYVGLPGFTVDPSKINWQQIKPIEEYRINELTIANKKLQKVKCPACGHEHMKIIMVMDKSQFGIIAKYQCESCRLLLTLSEQTHQMLKTMKPGHRYNYSGQEMERLASTMDDTRLGTSVQVLLKLCADNGISVDGLDLPPYYYREEKPVPVGFVIPKEDIFQKTISDLIDGLNKAERIGNTSDEPEGARYIQLSETLVGKIVESLGNLLKED